MSPRRAPGAVVSDVVRSPVPKPEPAAASGDFTDAQFRAFFAKLRRDPGVVRCGTTYVDVAGAVRRKVACGACMTSSSVRALAGKTCCTTFRVPVERAEVRRIAKVLPEVRKIRDVGAAVDRAGGFWHDEDGTPWLNERRGGGCVFLSAPAGGAPLCTLHEWAASRGRDHRRVKPETCCLFPLYLVEWGEEWFVTSYGTAYWAEMEPEETGDVKDFGCFHPVAAGRPLVVDQHDELAYRIGARRWAAMLRKLRALGHAV